MEYKDGEKESSVAQFLFQDIRKRHPEAAKVLPGLPVEGKDGERNSNNSIIIYNIIFIIII